ncbi:MAG: L-ribulose-5-phosphate 3-epimerase [Planctomycetota bacterium]|nr:L-ribulose-5-phosphate 3-epimerase [Planctomycetota bacterium]
MRTNPLGIYEKALPKNLSWPERFALAKAAGFDFVEMSVDETDERLSRLDWTREERLGFVRAVYDSGLFVPSMCLSGHRRFPLGSRDGSIRVRGRDIMRKGVDLALDLGIRNIQLAGYDVYYENRGDDTEATFMEGLDRSVSYAAARQVMLSVEIMDTDFMNSISKWKRWEKRINSPWFTVYPDIGNLTAWNNDVPRELALGLDRISAIHLKETLKVTKDFPGQFRDMPFGDGHVDFIAAFKTLKRLGYRGAFLIEMWTEKAEEPLVEIIKAKRWIEERMAEAGWFD